MYSEYVFIVLFTLNAKRLRCIIVQIMASLAVPYISTLPHKRHEDREKCIERKMSVLICYKILTETFLILRRIQRDIITNAHTSSCTVPLFFMYSTRILHVQYPYSSCTVPLFFMYSTPILHVQYPYSSCTIPLFFMYSTPILHVQHPYSSCTVPLFFMYSTPILHVQYPYSSCTVHPFFMYSTPILLRFLKKSFNFLDRF
jgi:hypothetical protein